MNELSLDEDFSILGDINSFYRFEGAKDLLESIESELGFWVEKVEYVKAGWNNGVFVLRCSGGGKLIGKFYHRDDRMRLNREYKACKFLRERGLTVPDALIRNDEYQFAVYSFEEGEHKEASQVSENEVMSLVDFIVDLQMIEPGDVDVKFEYGVRCTISYDEVEEVMNSRMDKIHEALDNGHLHPDVESFLAETDMVGEIDRLTKKILGEWDGGPWVLSRSEQRLSPVDFGVHNALFRGEDAPCVIDLEYFGWDDPLKILVDFLVHDKSADLSIEVKKKAVEYYCQKVGLSQEGKDRLDLLMSITNIEWILIYLQSLSPEYLNARSFSMGDDFDLEEYVARQIEKARVRYVQLDLKTL